MAALTIAHRMINLIAAILMPLLLLPYLVKAALTNDSASKQPDVYTLQTIPHTMLVGPTQTIATCCCSLEEQIVKCRRALSQARAYAQARSA
jgi:hypothetical protein